MTNRTRTLNREILQARLNDAGNLINSHEQTIIDALNTATPHEAVRVLLDYAITQPQILTSLHGYQPRKQVTA